MTTPHPFTVAGLGEAPFTLGSVVDRRRVASSCDACGHAVRYEFHIRSADGKTSRVGSDCILKLNSTADSRLIEATRRKVAQMKKQAEADRVKAMVARTANGSPDAEILNTHPHSRGFLGSALDEFRWMIANAGHTGQLRATRQAERLIESGNGPYTRPAEDSRIATLRQAIEGGKVRQSDMDFAQSLLTQYDNRGDLSMRQWPHVVRLAKVKEADIEINLCEMFEHFEKASDKIQYPEIVFETEHGPLSLSYNRRREIINVTDNGPYGNNVWYGRVASDGYWNLPRKAVPSWVKDFLHKIAEKGLHAVAHQYGKSSGRCCFCQRELSAPESTWAGYGKVCAGHYQMPWDTAGWFGDEEQEMLDRLHVAADFVMETTKSKARREAARKANASKKGPAFFIGRLELQTIEAEMMGE
jgi:hypothetical protein